MVGSKRLNQVIPGADGAIRPDGELDAGSIAILRQRVASNYYDDPRVVEFLAWAILLGSMHL
jgi:hypothetical protein